MRKSGSMSTFCDYGRVFCVLFVACLLDMARNRRCARADVETRALDMCNARFEKHGRMISECKRSSGMNLDVTYSRPLLKNCFGQSTCDAQVDMRLWALHGGCIVWPQLRDLP